MNDLLNPYTRSPEEDAELEVARQKEWKRDALTDREITLLTDFRQRIAEWDARYVIPATERLKAQTEAKEAIIEQLENLRAEKLERYRQIVALVREVESIGQKEVRLLAEAKR